MSTNPLTLSMGSGPVISLIILTLLSPPFVTGNYRTSSRFYTKAENDDGPYCVGADDVGAILRLYYSFVGRER